MAIRFVFLLFCISASALLVAQVPDFDQMKEQYDASKKQMQKKWVNYADSIDQAFANHIRDAWEAYESMPLGKSPLDESKPSAQPNSSQPTKEPTELNTPTGYKSPTPRRDVDKKDVDFSKLKMKQYSKGQFSYYSLSLPIEYDRKLQFDLDSPLSEGIAKAWEHLGSLDYQILLAQVHYIQQKLQLNDYGYFDLLQRVSQSVLPDQPNEQVVLTCFLLNKDGFVAKVAYNANDQVILLMPCQQDLYEISFFKIGRHKLYAFKNEGAWKAKLSSVTSYDIEYEGAEKVMDFKFYEAVRLPEIEGMRTIEFEYKGGQYELEIAYNETLIAFYENITPTSFELSLSAPLSDKALNAFKKQLQPMLEGKSQVEQADFLLAMIQNGFEYAIDQDQFGYEKYFYPEEILYHPQSDCEDRSALFACLVRDILGLEVVGLIFHDHVATAVHFTEELEGDFLMLNRKKFAVCDPTFIGATSGMCMPDYKRSEFEIVVLE